MKHGVSFTIDKQNGNLLNGNYHHHLVTKIFESVGVKGKFILEVFFYGQYIGHFEFFSEDKAVSIDILCRLGDAVRRKRPKNGEPTVGFSSTTYSITPVSFGQGFLGREGDNNGGSPILS
jgi:hypothetical protein